MNNENRFYVYEWYIVGSDKVFYVGKGTGKRRFDISTRNPDFKQLCKDFETKSRIVYDNLTEDEAIELEARQMLKRRVEGHILVNTILEYDFISWDDFDDETMDFIDKECDDSEEELEALKKRDFSPSIKVRDFISHYYGMPENLDYDSIDYDDLFCYFDLSYWRKIAPRIMEEVSFLTTNIIKIGGNVYKTKAKNVKYIVEFNIGDYERIIDFRNQGYKVIHAFNLIKHFNDGKMLTYKSKAGW